MSLRRFPTRKRTRSRTRSRSHSHPTSKSYHRSRSRSLSHATKSPSDRTRSKSQSQSRSQRFGHSPARCLVRGRSLSRSTLEKSAAWARHRRDPSRSLRDYESEVADKYDDELCPDAKEILETNYWVMVESIRSWLEDFSRLDDPEVRILADYFGLEEPLYKTRPGSLVVKPSDRAAKRALGQLLLAKMAESDWNPTRRGLWSRAGAGIGHVWHGAKSIGGKWARWAKDHPGQAAAGIVASVAAAACLVDPKSKACPASWRMTSAPCLSSSKEADEKDTASKVSQTMDCVLSERLSRRLAGIEGQAPFGQPIGVDYVFSEADLTQLNKTNREMADFRTGIYAEYSTSQLESEIVRLLDLRDYYLSKYGYFNARRMSIELKRLYDTHLFPALSILRTRQQQ